MLITRPIAEKVRDLVGAGLVKGMGSPQPGQMCVEAAVCHALGLPHDDNPPCVGSAVRAFKIRLNDANWSSDRIRGLGMRELALAQLGSDTLDQKDFARRISIETVRGLVAFLPGLSAEIVAECKAVKTVEQAKVAAHKARDNRRAAYAAHKARDNRRTAAAAAYAAAYADAAAAYAAATAYAADAAAYADAAAAATAYAAYAAAAYAAAATADAATAYAADAARDAWLRRGAEICLKVLTDMKAPGLQWLYLLEAV